MTSQSIRTITFLVRKDQVLLGLKKKGFGQGYLIGIGGKVEGKEKIASTAKREVKEEIGVNIIKLKKTGILNFYFPYIKDHSWDQQTFVFIASEWQGEPKETDEIKPQWFNQDKLPLHKMWDDAQYWLPIILKGKTIKGDFYFDKNNSKVSSYNITSLK